MSCIETCEASIAGGLWGTAGEWSYLMYDNGRTTYKGVIVALPGLNLGAYIWSPFAVGQEYEHVRALIRAGYVVLSIDGGSATLWPSPALNLIVDLAINTVLAKFATRLTGGAKYKVGLLGFSRGADSSLDYLIFHPTRVAGIFGFSPSPDLSAAYGPAGYSPSYGLMPAHATYQPQINTSFGCTTATYTAATAGYRMMDNAASFAGLCPIKFVHADDDAVAQIGIVQAWVAAVNDPHVTLHEVTTGGHGAFTSIDTSETVEFFNSLDWKTGATISDDFTRANSATTLGSTPVGSKLWTPSGSNVFGISSNLAYLATGGSGDKETGVDCGNGDGIIEVTLPTFNASGNRAGIIARTNAAGLAGGGTGGIVQYLASNTGVTLASVDGSGHVQTEFSTATVPSLPCTLRLALSGTTMTAFINGALVYSGIPSFPPTATRAYNGIYAESTAAGCRVSSFSYAP